LPEDVQKDCYPIFSRLLVPFLIPQSINNEDTLPVIILSVNFVDTLLIRCDNANENCFSNIV
ncbi:hypothetical protein, partial [Xenorhabdus hominickii]|uniref:hypothetical protein n=1 Tax=Xenorhabdus hominickii TaxID=351679 RepID=UPI001B80B2D4